MPYSVETGEWSFAENAFGKYCIPRASAHRVVARSLLEGEVWEPECIDFIVKNAADGDIVHAGAYFGDFLPALSQSVCAGNLVWSFEPSPSNFRAANETCRLNRISNVCLRQAALGSLNESRSIRWRSGDRELGGASRIVNPAAHPAAELLDVGVVLLDDVLPTSRKISVIHLDVEGFETEALRGAIETVRRWRPSVVIETYDADWVETNLAPLGYKRVGECDGNSILVV